MLRESPKHAQLIETHELEGIEHWENGKTKYILFFNSDLQMHKIGAPALVGWDQHGNKVFEEWLKYGQTHRSGSNQPALTHWDSKGTISHESWCKRGEVIETKEYSHSDAKVWSSTYEIWVDGIVGMHLPGPKYVLEDDTGKSYEYPESRLEFA